MSPKKTGRPTSTNPKEIKYSIRIDKETERRLECYCLEHKITKGEAIRIGISRLLDDPKND